MLPRLFSLVIFVLLSLGTGFRGWAFTLLDPQGLSAHEIKVVKPFLDATFELLPLKAKAELNRMSFIVRFEALPGLILGQTNSERTITLRKDFIELLKHPELQSLSPKQWLQKISKVMTAGTERKAKWPLHKTTLQLFRATFVHELMHFYDLYVLPALQQPSISTKPEFLNLAGFPERGFMIPWRSAVNHLQEASPDPYEWKNPREALAVNMEYFVLDPSFSCRRPGLDRLFREHFGLPQKRRDNTCPLKPQVLINFSTQHEPSVRWETWDFAKLYQIHYLYAGSGAEGSSRFGHAMLRLVFCAPSRTQVGPDCLKDVFAHRVVSFRAAVNQPVVDWWKGLNGDYPAILFLMPFADVHRDYTYKEMRELFSLPLALTLLEKQRLFDRIVEMHWSYQGAYRFLSDNCAHETMNLLQSALLERSMLSQDFVIRPDSLYGDLLDLRIASGLPLNENRDHFPKSQYFSSQRELFEKSLEALVKQRVFPAKTTLDAFLESSTSVRLAGIEALGKMGDKKLRSRMTLGFLNLQQLILDRLLKKVLDEHFIPYIQKASEDTTNVVHQEIQTLARYLADSSLPWIMGGKKGEYGIPQVAAHDPSKNQEQDALFVAQTERARAAWKQFMTDLPPNVRGALETEQALIDLLYTILNRKDGEKTLAEKPQQ